MMETVELEESPHVEVEVAENGGQEGTKEKVPERAWS